MANINATKRREKKKNATSSETSKIEAEMAANFSYAFKIKKSFHLNDNHRNFYNCIKEDDSSIIFVDGPAGSAKTYLAVLAALELFKEKKCKQIIYIRSIIESASRSLGSLPGEVDDKFSQFTQPLLDKISEITDPTVAANLKAGNIISAIPVNFCRGMTFNDAVVIVDEFQNMNFSESKTVLSRIGKNTRYIVCGDSHQMDIKDSCIIPLLNAFDTDKSQENNIYVHRFGKSDIVRSKMLRYIMEVIETIPKK